MSEVKGTLLGIVLAITVFTIVFGIISIAVGEAATDVGTRMKDAAVLETEVQNAASGPFSLRY